MPLPTLLSIAFASGIAAALASRAELRISPRPVWLTRSFFAYMMFAVLVLVPVSMYFYVFHSDWFLMYLVDVRRVPSAIALIGFALEAGLGAAGFGMGAALVRTQRESIAATVIAISLAASVLVVVIGHERLSSVGTYAQYKGRFGLLPYGSGAFLAGTIAMGVLLLAALTYLLLRLYLTGRRS